MVSSLTIWLPGEQFDLVACRALVVPVGIAVCFCLVEVLRGRERERGMVVNAIWFFILLICSVSMSFLSEWVLAVMRSQLATQMTLPVPLINGFFFFSDLIFSLGIGLLSFLVVRKGRIWKDLLVFALGVGMLVLSIAGFYHWVSPTLWVEPGTAPFRFAVFALLIGLVGVFVQLRARRKGHGSS